MAYSKVRPLSSFQLVLTTPSFTAPVSEGVVAYVEDLSHGMQRIETLCAVCDGHLGHVFPDGPPPTGLRYCINAVALQKESA